MTQVPFDRIVAEHGDVVLRVCRALLGHSGAEDAWSETFLAALRAYPGLPADSNVKGWLVTIAHNKSIDVLRSRHGTVQSVEGMPDRAGPPGIPDPGDEDLWEALRALPPKQRGAVVLRYLGDLSYARVAELLECSEAAARRSASDGIAKLRATYPNGVTT